MKFGCISSIMKNENKVVILKILQKEPVHTWLRGQDAVPRRQEKANFSSSP